MQEFLAQVIVTFGDLLSSLGFIVIGLLSRRLWLVLLLALIWAAVAYAIHLQDQLGVPFQELPQAVDWEQVKADAPLRAGIAVAISFASWVCMSLIIGSFRPSRKRERRRETRPVDEPEVGTTRSSGQLRVEPAMAAPAAPAARRSERMEPRLQPGVDEDGVPPLPVGLRPQAQPAQPAPPPPRPASSFDVVLPRDPAAAAAALRRLYGEDELRRLLAELGPPNRG
ncbi:MAG: hypothetical protein R3F55_00220 [Alphaproteobacteria bacterium]